MPRRGYTLFELVIVMAIIVVVASLSMPLAEALFNPNRLTAAGDMVRGQLAEMRGRAMGEGRPYRFEVLENTGQFRIGPAGDAADGWQFEGELPENVLFVKSEDVLLAGSEPPPAEDWQTVVVYLPDGSAQDEARLPFGLPGFRPMTLIVRDLTGAISILEPSAPREDLP